MQEPSTAYRLPLRDRLPRPLGAVLSVSWLKFGFVVVVALILGDQIGDPTGRIIKALAGLVLMFAAFRSKPYWALSFIAVAFLFPFGIFVGSSTTIFIGLTTTAYLARLTLGQVPALRGTPVDAGVFILASAYVLSFYNVDDPFVLQKALLNVYGIFASFLLFFMTANFIRTTQQLKRFVDIMLIAAALAVFVGLYELLLPGRVLIPHFILQDAHAKAFSANSYGYLRVGGPLYDYELFGEYMAISFFLAYFAHRRARSVNKRFFMGALALLCVFVMLTTVTRGCVVAFLVGFIYMLWSIRRRLKFRDLVGILLTSVGIYLVMEFVVVNFTHSGSVLERMLNTYFVGYLPDSRAGWGGVLERALTHPFVGHGAWYDLGRSHSITGQGLYSYSWPHSQFLYYLHTVGFVGLLSFLFIVGRLFYISFRNRAVGFEEKSYARSLMLVLNIMLLVFLTDQTKIDYLRNPVYQYYPWILFGLIAATYRIIKDEDADQAARAAASGTG